MAVPFLPIFSAGQILTSDDMNETGSAVNSLGLFFVKSQTIGNAVSSVTVTGAFSADYDNYLITVSGGVNSVDGNVLDIKFGSTVTGYYFAMVYASWNSVVSAAGSANTSRIDYVAQAGTQSLNGFIEVNSPFLTENTTVRASVANSTFYGGTTNGLLKNTTSYTSFILSTSAGTMTGGTIRVYGLRNSYS
jgi:hypothetical protein